MKMQWREGGGVVLLLIVLTAGWWVSPSQIEGVPLCLFNHLFHVDCPGCGLSRSFLALARGHVIAAFGYNAAGPLVYLLLTAYLVSISARFFGRGSNIVLPACVAKYYGMSVVVLLFGHWVLRLSHELPGLFF